MLNKLDIFQIWRVEFKNYSLKHFQSDLGAGLTVAAVALPLALAFGIASGATAAAGLITAIISGFVIGTLSGAAYQISGPTGAMSAVLIVIVQKYGLPGLWIATIMAGIILLALGLFKLGRIVNFIPAPVITGFTSGIALIIFTGQIDNFLGIKTPAAESTTLKVIGYFSQPLPSIVFESIACALIVIAIMLGMPLLKYTSRWPVALLSISLVTIVSWVLGWKVATIGNIPGSLILDDRYNLQWADLSVMGELLGPATAIAALCAIESLLAGLVAERMTGTKLNSNQELVSQGVGNVVIPFFGGVPATAAIARMSVGIKAGGVTRLVSIIHSVALLFCVFFLSGVIARIPLAALAGVLMVTALRMNEWHVIRFYIKHRLKGPVLVMLITMAATVSLDLSQAIVIGVMVSLVIFITQVSRLEIVPTRVDPERLRLAGHHVPFETAGMWVVYLSGSLFFGATGQLIRHLENMENSRVLILSMRGVPMIDVSGLHALEHLWQRQLKKGGLLYLTGLTPQVQRMFERTGLIDLFGADKFFWSADQAILRACETLEGPATTPLTKGRDYVGEMPLGVAVPD
jgi:SulP family sulfate permease